MGKRRLGCGERGRRERDRKSWEGDRGKGRGEWERGSRERGRVDRTREKRQGHGGREEDEGEMGKERGRERKWRKEGKRVIL